MWIVAVIIAAIVLWMILRALGKGSKGAKRGSSASSQRISPRPILDAPAPPRIQPPPETASMRWHGKGTMLDVAGIRLRDPHVYASAGRRGSYDWATDPSEILLSAEVRRPRGPVPDMGYWPWYSRIEPEHRFLYLDWLASGKITLPPAEGLLFLYFYGIERRLLVDEQDKEWALREVVRLRKLDEPRRGTRDGRSFRLYSSALLWFEVARAPELFNERAFGTVCDLTEAWNEAMMPAPLSWLARHNRPLSTDLALRVARLNPRSVQSVVTKRVSEQFGDLFGKRYTEKFGAGLDLKVSKRPRRHTYRPASGGLEEAACTIGDPTGIPSQFEPLADLWNQCVEDLRGLSRVAAGVDGTLTVQAWEAMPVELREGVDHPLAHAIQSVVASARQGDITDHQHATLVSAGELGAAIGIEQRPKLTASQSRRVADTIQHAGFAIEPDTRMTARAYAWDDRVAVFLPSDAAHTDRSRYLGAACFLQLGLTIAEADGVVDPEELRRLSENIDAVFQLPASEMQRLDALRAVLLSSGADLGAVSKRLETLLSPDARRQAGRLLVAIAAASGNIDRKELAALRKCFRALALPPEQLDETVAQILPQAGTDFVTVAAGQSGVGGEPIPPHNALRLNREAISAILAETREVATLLATAMSEDSESEQPASEVTAVVVTAERVTAEPMEAPAGAAADSGLPARYGPFLSALRVRTTWNRDEAVALAREHRVMLDGAIEAINEWALEAGGTPLIDEVDGVLLIDAGPR
ncbi:MAG: hypothetical protein HBSAPP03_25830 [Phycisphaerae bacterium]|nr:MAG: hypothetical protein HBSAPP03_25830 [Phycisphaerae bacterium]